jgi:hypothetical protein
MPEGKPHTAVTSKSQSRKLFALANRGEVSMADAKGKTRAANWDTLPQRKGTKRGRRSAGRSSSRRA